MRRGSGGGVSSSGGAPPSFWFVNEEGWRYFPTHNAQRIPQQRTTHNAKGIPTHNAPYSGKQLWAFCHEMNEGDLVILSTGKRRAVMRVTGDYEFVPAGDALGHYKHHRQAVLTGLDPNDLWHEAGPAAQGWGTYWALVRCRNEVNTAGKRPLWSAGILPA